MPDPSLGHHYRIQNKYTKQYISPERRKIGFNGKSPVMRDAYPYDKANDFAFRRQSWHVFPLDGAKGSVDRCMIVNAAGGDILAPLDVAHGSFVHETHLWKQNKEWLQLQTWVLKPVKDDAGYFYIVNLASNRFLSPHKYEAGTLDENPDNSKHWAWVAQYDRNDTDHDDIYRWSFEDPVEVPLPKGDPPSSEVTLSTPRMKGRDDPGDGEKILCGSTVVPFLAIQEPYLKANEWETQGSRFYQRAETTPYYLIERRAYWKRLGFNYYRSPEGRTETVEVSHGLTREDATTVEQTTGISVKASLGVEFQGVSASISTELTEQLHLTHATKTETTSMTKTTVKITYPKMQAFAMAYWVRADEFVVKKLNSRGELEKVFSWETQNSKQTVSNSEQVDVKEGATK
jgi:hypothetical protein